MFARLRIALFASIAFLGAVAPSLADGVLPGHAIGDRVVTAGVHVEGPLSPGASTGIRIDLVPAAGWHLYGPERGDAGAPPAVAWTLPPGIRAGAIAFPPSLRVTTQGLTTYEYRGPVALHVRLSASSMLAPHAGVPIVADVSWLACAHVCVPGNAVVRTTFDVIPAPASLLSVLAFVGLAFLGGLVLNLMPCVFPVLSFKALRAIGEPEGRRRQMAFAYAAGVTASCTMLGALLLAARAAGAAIGWGFQLQSPAFVAFLTVLMLILALAMSGAIEVTLPIPYALQRRAAAAGAFGDGVLVTLIASACVGPYLGAALGFALSASPPAAIGIFVALGLGLALPQSLLMLIPALLRWVPKPGAWMVTARRVLALPLYASALWLAWVFVQQIVPPAPAPAPESVARQTAGTFSTASLAQLRREHRAVLVDVGAAWCITCQVNERFALARPEVERRLAALGVTVLHGDWTNQDPQITAYLRSLGTAGVPLYVFYRNDGAVDVWPQLLTPRLILDRLPRA